MSGIHHGEGCDIVVYAFAGGRPAPDFDRMHALKMLAPRRKISMLRATIAPQGSQSTARLAARLFTDRGILPVKVIASSLRKGNIVDLDGRLYVILTAENIHPGKGTPVTQVDMRRLSDGVKSSQRYKTTDQVERAHVEEREFQFLYQDGDGFHFMNMESYDQIAVQQDVIGDQAVYLQPEMKVRLSVHEGVAVGIVLPPRVTLEVTETEPTTKGQTASSSYKPAVLSNGLRTSVPPHIVAGTRIVVSTEDGSYVERAKD
jgi:elongation factor P